MTTPHSADALKPCPFCGGNEVGVLRYGNRENGAHFSVVCGGCAIATDWHHAGTEEAARANAIAAWNRRPTPASPSLDNEAAARLRKQAEEAKKVRGVVALSPEDAFALLNRLERAEGFERMFHELRRSIRDAEAAAGAALEGTAKKIQGIAQWMDSQANQQQTGLDTFDYATQFDYDLAHAAGELSMIANNLAAPPAQGLPAAPDDPMDWRLPCDVKVGAGTHKKGTTLRSLVSRMEMLYGMAMKAHPVDEAKAAEFRAFLDQQFGSSPPAAAPSEPVAWRWKLGSSEASDVLDNPWRFSATPLMPYKDRIIEPLCLATPPAQDAGTGEAKDAERWRWFRHHGFFWRGPYCLQTCWPRHGEIGAPDPSIGKAAIIDAEIDCAIANSGRTE